MCAESSWEITLNATADSIAELTELESELRAAVVSAFSKTRVLSPMEKLSLYESVRLQVEVHRKGPCIENGGC